jgi:haloacid dehalogenase-like hydrolase
MSGCSASSEPVAAVLFDLGDTLVSYYRPAEFEPVLRRSLAAMTAVLHELPGKRRTFDAEALLERAKAFNVERDDYRVWPLGERLGQLFGLDSVPAEFDHRLTAAFLEPIFSIGRLDPDALEVLRQLRARGLKTAIVSNTPSPRHRGGQSSRACAFCRRSTRRCSAWTSAGASPRLPCSSTPSRGSGSPRGTRGSSATSRTGTWPAHTPRACGRSCSAARPTASTVSRFFVSSLISSK